MTLPLSNINVFIGENGCGKSNILEAVAFLSLALFRDLNNENLFSKGVRNAKPELIFNSFKKRSQLSSVSFEFKDESGKVENVQTNIEGNDSSVFPKWKSTIYNGDPTLLKQFFEELINEPKLATLGKDSDEVKKLEASFNEFLTQFKFNTNNLSNWANFAIFTPNALALRGFQIESQKEPLGIYGENLDVLLSSFSKEERSTLEMYKNLISWLDEFEFDEGDLYKFQGYKTGRSKSRLYFRDKFMQKKNNVFSAENANEGVLHILFYLALFISRQTPQFFAIDNIETALNPKLCRNLIKTLSKIATQNEKQALITTHNPAILDGLDLNDNRQRLFVVKRNDDGHTKIERIKLKPETNGEQLKLSEMWMRGLLGGLPTNF